MRRILVLNGPNLDMLGVREPDIYGRETLADLENRVRRYGERRGVGIVCYQSNSEGVLISKIHSARGEFDGIVYNPGAHTHYSYALRDAVASVDVPVVEVHISDVDGREDFRRVSVIAPVCVARVKALGIEGYCRAVDILCEEGELARLGEGYEQVSAGKTVVLGSGADFGEAHHGMSAGVPGDSSARMPAGALEETPEEGLPSALHAAPAPVEDLASAGASEPSDDATAAQAPVSGGSPGDGQPPVDYAAPFAEAAAALDAGRLSFNRQTAVRNECARMGIRGLLVRDTSNVRWITAFDGVFDDERAHALLIADGRAVLHTDSRYSNAVRTAASRIGSNVAVTDERMSHARFARIALAASDSRMPGAKLGMEDTITYAEFVKMVEQFSSENLAPTSELVLNLRAVKDSSEVARLKGAQAVTDAAFTHIVEFIRPGMTERDVQLELEDFMVRHGAEGLAFSSIVATGPNGADPHAIPGKTRLEAGQCVVLDFGAIAYGYCSDMTRTVFLGAPEGEMAAAWETLRRANETVEGMLRPGLTGAAAHQIAEKVLEEGGFGGRMGHGLGHGVGIDVHELPVLNPHNELPLVEGNVVTVEPGIYLPGKFGMRLEDFGIVTASGFDVFTQSTHEMVII